MTENNYREYRTLKKDDWGPGPWMKEPDKAQWIDEATGLDCLIVRQPRAGHLCGYVGVPPGHVLYEKDWQEADELLDMHGGCTFSRFCQPHETEDSGICHVPGPGRPDQVWWIGFDCAHSGDFSPGLLIGLNHCTYKPFEYVQKQCADLAAQLATL